MSLIDSLQKTLPGFPAHLGMVFTEASPNRVTATMVVREDLCTETKSIHGGALMAFADTLGAVATIINIPREKWTTTIESKTNFIAPAPAGTKLVGQTTPLHKGSRTHIWETVITREDGKVVAKTTQTQMVLDKPGAKA
jgi:1,4-dihydroxy-2-naphthoyl-CoA hydrolase